MKNIIKLTFLALAFASCGGGDYPPFRYTNTSGTDISFQTGEKDSPVYELTANEILLLDSDLRGRGDVINIKPSYVMWERENHDEYDIVFVVNGALPVIPVEIENHLTRDIVITDESGYLSPQYCEAAAMTGTTPGTKNAESYTKTPEFKLVEADPGDPKKWVDFSGSVNIAFYIDTDTAGNEKIIVTVH